LGSYDYAAMLLALEAVDHTGPLVIGIREGAPLFLYPGLRIVRALVLQDDAELAALVEELAQRMESEA